MKIHLYQIIVLAISITMLYQGVDRFIKGKNGQTIYKLFVRVAVWGGMALITLFPSFTNVMANIVGLKGNINAVILTSFLLIFLMIFKLLSAIERLEQDISNLTRKDALDELKK